MDPENMHNLRGACAPFGWNLVGGALPGKARLLAGSIAVAAMLVGTDAQAFTRSETAAAKTAILDVDHDKWEAAYNAAEDAHFPLLTKLITWMDLTRPGTSADFSHLRTFIQQNPDWPQQNTLRRHAEDAITDSTPPAEVVSWFQQSPPLGPIGAGRYVDALNATNQHAQAEATARQFLVDGTMNAGEVTDFANRYQPMLRQVDFELRADRLIWAGKYNDASALLSYVPANNRPVIQARIALETQAADAQTLLSGLSKDQMNDLGLLYDRMRWLRKQNRDSEAIALLAIAPPTLPHASQWWNERAVLARRALENGDVKTAYALARDHRQASGPALADGEWLSGWIALRSMNDPKAALQHFQTMLTSVTTPISTARAAYWAGRAEDALGDQAAATHEYTKAAQYNGTYYGLLALAKLNPSAKLTLPPQPQIAGLDARAFSNRELVQVTQLLESIGMADRGDAFVRRIAELARTPQDALLAMKLAKTNNSLAAEVSVSKKLMQGGMPVLADGYPVIAQLGPKAPEPALIHAIIRQESMFDAGAVSPSGALGLMQLMPPTARSVASKLKIKKFNPNNLTTDPRTNVVLGSSYLAGLVDKFSGSYVMAIAGYNAGPGRVNGWLGQNGDPRPKLDDTIDWIEKISVNETRNYVQRVMENLQVYRARMAGGSAPNRIADDMVR
jgi:soluble lytic murein transglycosylase